MVNVLGSVRQTRSANTHVLHIAEAFDPGGVAWWLIDVNKILVAQGVQADFLCLGRQPGMRSHEVIALGCALTTFQPTLSEVIRGDTLRGLLHQKQYDIVHAHVFNLSGWLLRHAAAAKIPIRIAHFHNTDDGRSSNLATTLRRQISRRMVSQYANAILACSAPALTNAPRASQGSVREVVPYGIDLQAFGPRPIIWDIRAQLGLPADAHLVGHVGRFYEQKNHAGLVRIFAQVLRHDPQAHLIMVGDGPLQPPIKQLASALGIQEHVWFLGARPDVADLMPQFNVFAFPSLHEGVGIVLIEARMSSVPVVASDLPAIRQLLEQCTGYRLNSYQDEKEFAGSIIEFLRDCHPISAPVIWKHQYSRERSATMLLEVYRTLLAQTKQLDS